MSGLGTLSGPLTPFEYRNFLRSRKYGFLISSLSTFNLPPMRVGCNASLRDLPALAHGFALQF